MYILSTCSPILYILCTFYKLFCVSMSIIIRVLLSDFRIIIVLDVIIRYILQKWVGLIACCVSFRACKTIIQF